MAESPLILRIAGLPWRGSRPCRVALRQRSCRCASNARDMEDRLEGSGALDLSGDRKRDTETKSQFLALRRDFDQGKSLERDREVASLRDEWPQAASAWKRACLQTACWAPLGVVLRNRV